MHELSSSPFSVFISYAHADDNDTDVSKHYLHRCRRQLASLTRQGRVKDFTDKDIKVGDRWKNVLIEALENAKAAILLIGPEFFCSEFIREVEVPMLLEKVDSEGLTILLVILSPVLLEENLFKYPNPEHGPKETSLSVFQCAHPASESLSSMKEHEQEKVFVRVAQAVRDLVDPKPPPKVASTPLAEEHVKMVEGALDLLSDLVRTSNEVRQTVREFRSTFEEASADIERLTSYKALHDLLHVLQFECLELITVELPSFPDDPKSEDRLIPAEYNLEQTIKSICMDEQRWQRIQVNTSRLLEDLNLALKELKAAFDNQAKSHLKRAHFCLDRVLSNHPTKINARLLDAARKLEWPKLIETMSDLHSQLTRIGVKGADRQQLSDGITSLTALDVRLRDLFYEHDEWQTVDGEMRIEEVNNEEFLEKLQLSWPRIKSITEILYRDNAAELAAKLEQDSARLDAALESKSISAVQSAYRRFRWRAAKRFYQVDTDLLNLCSKLEDVAAPLDKMLSRLHPELDARVSDAERS